MVDTETRYLEDLQTKHPDIASLLSDFATLYQRKLSHPLTVKLEESLQLPEFGKDGFLIDLYSHFISHFGHRINLLKLAQFAVRASQQFDGPQQAGEAHCVAQSCRIHCRQSQPLTPCAARVQWSSWRRCGSR